MSDPSTHEELSIVRFDSFETAFPVSGAGEAKTRRRFMTLLAPSSEAHSGAMGTVSRVRNARGETFALKRLRADALERAGDNEAFKQGLIDAFHEEYRTQFVLSHLKGFPALYGYGTIDGLPAILMEWVEGETLRHARTMLATEPGSTGPRIPATTVAAIGISVLEVLGQVEQLDRRLVHRDLSPNNIMIRTGAQPVAEQVAAHRFDICLIDFGSSTLIEPEQATTFTRLSNTWRYGTDEYAAPEMLTRDVPNIDQLRQSPSIDIYALCSVLYELYADATPYAVAQHQGASPYVLKCAELSSLTQLRDVADAPLLNAICAGIAPRQEDRIARQELMARLRSWLDARLNGSGMGSVPSGASRDAAFAAIRAREVADQARGRISHWQALDGRGARIPDTRSGDAMARAARPARRASTGASVQAGRPSSDASVQGVASSRSVKTAGAAGKPVSRRVAVGCGVLAVAGIACAGAALGMSKLLERANGTAADDTDTPPPTGSDAADPDPAAPQKPAADGPLWRARDAASGLWGFIDESGAWAIEPAFSEEPTAFVGDLACAADAGSRLWGFIDRTGAWIIEPAFAAVHTFAEGLAAACDAKSGLWGYIDVQGTWAIEPHFADAQSFCGGIAPAKQTEDDADDRQRVRYGQLWGFIDATGTWAVDPQFAGARPFSEDGLTAVCRTERSWEFVDTAGNEAFAGTWSDARGFCDGLAAVMDGDSERWGFVNAGGTLAISCDFSDVQDFSEGFAPACDREMDLWGAIDTSGSWKISPAFSEMRPFENGLAAARDAESGRWGFIDADGTWRIDPAFA